MEALRSQTTPLDTAVYKILTGQQKTFLSGVHNQSKEMELLK